MDEAGDVMLSDDLAALGDRLRSEADMLAEQYPARSADGDVRTQATRTDGKPTVRVYWLATAAVASVLLAVAVWPLVNGLVQRSSDTHTRVTESPLGTSPSRNVDDSVSPAATSHSIGAIHVDTRPADYQDERSIESTPAVFLQDVSGPELEGLLDLWEQEQSATFSVSI
jgi:hypothetical protein